MLPPHCLFSWFLIAAPLALGLDAAVEQTLTFFLEDHLCVRACGHARGAITEPSAIECPSIPSRSGMARGGWEAGEWRGALDACWNAKPVELENGELPAASLEEISPSSWTEKLQLAPAVSAELQLESRSRWTSRPDRTKQVGKAVVLCASVS